MDETRFSVKGTKTYEHSCMNKLICLVLLAGLLCGCRAPRTAQVPAAPHIRVLTYNVNWGGARPDLAADAIRRSGAEIVCLQETTPQWEQYFRQALGREYTFAEFRNSKMRMGGGLGFLAKVSAREVACVPSETGWFDGWIMKVETGIGPVQVINVHLRPPVSDRGSWVSGYFTTRDDRRQEMERFYGAREPHLPTLVVGDFNDSENSPVVQWLEDKGMVNALPQFDRYSPTWKWQTSVVTLKRRMDHVLYSTELDCAAARVIPAGASDHFPVEAILTKAK
jgi:endonuclease/exonuclease/phosphatase family metal-dependent hydrolase